MKVENFRNLLRENGTKLYRHMPWRDDLRPYYVLVSEIMLQQTQVARVVPKFQEFTAKFPDEKVLAQASLADVLKIWQGLGYNRRAKHLHDAAKEIVRQEKFPNNEKDLVKLPGVGKNTAGAILAYAFNKPAIFVETNIRTVYIHHFFADQGDVSDKEIIAKLGATIDRKNPRKFFQNLMDYGAWLKANGAQNILKSKHYKKQPKLAGSLREMRGMIIRELLNGDQTESEFRKKFVDDDRFEVALHGLLLEGLVTRGRTIHLTR